MAAAFSVPGACYQCSIITYDIAKIFRHKKNFYNMGDRAFCLGINYLPGVIKNSMPLFCRVFKPGL